MYGKHNGGLQRQQSRTTLGPVKRQVLSAPTVSEALRYEIDENVTVQLRHVREVDLHTQQEFHNRSPPPALQRQQSAVGKLLNSMSFKSLPGLKGAVNTHSSDASQPFRNRRKRRMKVVAARHDVRVLRREVNATMDELRYTESVMTITPNGSKQWAVAMVTVDSLMLLTTAKPGIIHNMVRGIHPIYKPQQPALVIPFAAIYKIVRPSIVDDKLVQFKLSRYNDHKTHFRVLMSSKFARRMGCVMKFPTEMAIDIICFCKGSMLKVNLESFWEDYYMRSALNIRYQLDFADEETDILTYETMVEELLLTIDVVERISLLKDMLRPDERGLNVAQNLTIKRQFFKCLKLFDYIMDNFATFESSFRKARSIKEQLVLLQHLISCGEVLFGFLHGCDAMEDRNAICRSRNYTIHEIVNLLGSDFSTCRNFLLVDYSYQRHAPAPTFTTETTGIPHYFLDGKDKDYNLEFNVNILRVIDLQVMILVLFDKIKQEDALTQDTKTMFVHIHSVPRLLVESDDFLYTREDGNDDKSSGGVLEIIVHRTKTLIEEVASDIYDAEGADLKREGSDEDALERVEDSSRSGSDNDSWEGSDNGFDEEESERKLQPSSPMHSDRGSRRRSRSGSSNVHSDDEDVFSFHDHHLDDLTPVASFKLMNSLTLPPSASVGEGPWTGRSKQQTFLRRDLPNWGSPANRRKTKIRSDYENLQIRTQHRGMSQRRDSFTSIRSELTGSQPSTSYAAASQLLAQNSPTRLLAQTMGFFKEKRPVDSYFHDAYTSLAQMLDALPLYSSHVVLFYYATFLERLITDDFRIRDFMREYLREDIRIFLHDQLVVTHQESESTKEFLFSLSLGKLRTIASSLHIDDDGDQNPLHR
uniref:Uncharacterized protein n=1 Tax=Phaeomonas parva TaxID=124430 RepID=A0A7S1UD50_9STRA